MIVVIASKKKKKKDDCRHAMICLDFETLICDHGLCTCSKIYNSLAVNSDGVDEDKRGPMCNKDSDCKRFPVLCIDVNVTCYKGMCGCRNT